MASGPRPRASAGTKKSLEMHIPGPHPRFTESETLGVGSRDLCFNKNQAILCKLRNTALRVYDSHLPALYSN